MTAFTALASGDLDPESPINTTLMNALYNNPLAMFEGTGPTQIQTAAYAAASVDQTAIGSNAVGQSELKLANATQSAGTLTFFVNPGGSYQTGSAPNVGMVDGAGLPQSGVGTVAFWYASSANQGPSYSTTTAVAAGVYASYMWIVPGYTGAGSTVASNVHYVQASPPYNLGDGVCSKFIFAVVDSNGKIKSTWIAWDAPWHNNGPTMLRPSFYKSGTPYRVGLDLPFTMADAMADSSKAQQVTAALQTMKTAGLDVEKIMRCPRAAAQAFKDDPTLPLREIEITQAIKQADMPLVPHPFGPLDAGDTVVMLDPVSDLSHRLSESEDASDGEFRIDTLLHNGNLIIDNTPLQRSGPPGVQVVAAKWKATA